MTTRKTRVSATSKMVSAISLGVFCRFAASTIEIIRSRKVSPGLTDTRTTIQSDSTRVPPVTDEKSPPDSRMTGADSPVMALSSTDADALDDLAVGRNDVMRLDQHHVAFAQILRLDECRLAGAPRVFGRCVLAITVWRMLRSADAWARLRPSASASAKLANSTVNSSQTVMARMKPPAPRRGPRAPGHRESP